MAFVTAAGVTKRFGAHVAVDDVSLELDRGEAVALFGANGAGKTTLIRLFASLSRPSEGRISVAGRELTDANPDLRSRFGVVTHDAMVYDDLTARENLRLHARLHGVDQSVCADRLAAVGLADRAGDRVGQFSHGMRKRLALARALVHDPDLLLLDEPYTGLDRASLDRVDAVVSDLGDVALLVATHDLDRGYRLADRLVFLDGGRVAADVPADECDGPADVQERYRRLCEPEPVDR